MQDRITRAINTRIALQYLIRQSLIRPRTHYQNIQKTKKADLPRAARKNREISKTPYQYQQAARHHAYYRPHSSQRAYDDYQKSQLCVVDKFSN